MHPKKHHIILRLTAFAFRSAGYILASGLALIGGMNGRGNTQHFLLNDSVIGVSTAYADAPPPAYSACGDGGSSDCSSCSDCSGGACGCAGSSDSGCAGSDCGGTGG